MQAALSVADICTALSLCVSAIQCWFRLTSSTTSEQWLTALDNSPAAVLVLATWASGKVLFFLWGAVRPTYFFLYIVTIFLFSKAVVCYCNAAFSPILTWCMCCFSNKSCKTVQKGILYEKRQNTSLPLWEVFSFRRGPTPQINIRMHLLVVFVFIVF